MQLALKNSLSFPLTCAALALTLSGCGASASKYEPIVDGHKGQHYYADLNECQALSRERKYVNDDVKSEALLGAVLGAILESDSTEDAVAGAIAGGLIMGGSAAWETRYERKDIVLACMSNRGHKVVG